MKEGTGNCDPVLVMRYMDRELNPRESVQVGQHVARCARCRAMMREAQSLADVFKEGFAHAVGETSLDGLEQAVWSRIRQRSGGKEIHRRVSFFKKVLVPVGALAVGALFFFSFFNPFEKVLEPSAIINSFTAETSSVMILETPGTRQTILWFQEIPGKGGEDEGMQQV